MSLKGFVWSESYQQSLLSATWPTHTKITILFEKHEAVFAVSHPPLLPEYVVFETRSRGKEEAGLTLILVMGRENVGVEVQIPLMVAEQGVLNLQRLLILVFS
jgi:hypothetical protein